jgi:Brp/Blh family beta-carotene 15,15'-monooxygenase
VPSNSFVFPPPLAPRSVYAGALSLTVAVAGAAAAGLSLRGGAGLALLGAAVLLTGMPHGAVDHLVARQLFAWRGVRGTVLFYVGYLALAALYGLGWWIWPPGALAFFLLMAVYHFGQADLAHRAPRSRAGRVTLYLSRGLFVVGSPLGARPEAVAPVVDALAGVALPAALPAWWPVACVATLAAQHAGVLAALAHRTGTPGRREWLTVPALALLFWAAPPLAAFATYFGSWHALGHVLVLTRFFRAARGDASGATTLPVTVGAFYRQAALYTLVPLGGLAALLLARPAAFAANAAEALAALFVLISVLTLPHMLLVERLYRHERHRLAQAGMPPPEEEEGSLSRSSS